MQSLQSILDSYCLVRELRPSTEAYYRRLVSVYSAWAKSNPHAAEFTAESVSRFLLDKQRAGLSSYYRKSLRNGLRALLAHAGVTIARGGLRTVKLSHLEPSAWTEEEVGRLVAAVDVLYEHNPPERQYMRTLILAAYYTGASQIDLHRLSRHNIAPNGVVRYVRSKTGRSVLTAMPVDLIPQLPKGDPIWPLKISPEMFRRRFAKIVKVAKLKGTFKTLRKSSGTGVEAACLGRGHEHLGNSRKVFETHYLARGSMEVVPILPKIVPVVVTSSPCRDTVAAGTAAKSLATT